MARILIPHNGKNVWFEQIAPSTFSESEIENRIILHAPTVYPEYHVLPFKLTVESEAGNKSPDLIFIAKDYSDWWVCEVELGNHNLTSHIEAQVEVFTEALYGEREAKYICDKAPFLDYDKTLKLFQDLSAKVIVIANEPKKEWGKPLRKYGAVVAVFELFRSEDNDEIFRVNGEYPSRYIKQLSKCFIHPVTSRYLGVENPEALNLPKNGRITLHYNNCLTEWLRVDANGQVWLQPTGKSFLDGNGFYEIFVQGNNTLVLRQYEEVS